MILSAGLEGQSATAAKFTQFLMRKPGVEMNIEIRQQQFENISVDTGTVELVGPGQYLFDSRMETVHVNGTLIKTWNKKTEQLIIDETIAGEFSLFHLLSGNMEGVIFTELKHHNKKYATLFFDVPQIGISGKVNLDPESGRPFDLELIYGPDQSIKISVLRLKSLRKNNLYSSFNPLVKEVIDLRE